MEIALRSLDKTYGDESVLDDVTVGVGDGEFCVVVGPSGCGKTTLLHCVAGLESPDGGSVRLDGEPVDGVPPGERGLGLVFQDFEERLFPHMTVAENVAFGLEQADEQLPEPEIERRVDDLLELLAIPETRDDHPENLSGGQQQRVELARQLVRDCDTLLLDDPLSDLDYKLQKRMELELRRLHATEGNTVVYVTHNQDQALKLADTLVVMNRGRVEQVAPPDRVYYRPATAFVGRFVGDSNLLVGEPAGADDGDDDGNAGADGGTGTDRAPGTDGEERIDREARTGSDERVGGDGETGRDGRTDGADPADGDERTVRVSTDAGTVAARTEPPVDGSATGVVLVRPTDVTISGAASEGGEIPNGITGVLADRIYTGDRTEFVVSVPDVPEEFQVLEPGDVGFDDVGATVGDEVALGWAPVDAVYFGPDRFSASETFGMAELGEV